MFCRNCGKQAPDNAAFCMSCGVQILDSRPAENTVVSVRSPKSATTAAILNFFIPGLGEIYLNQMITGVAILIFWICFAVIIPEITGTSRIFYLPFWIFAMIHAYIIGKKLEAGRTVKEWE